MNWYELWWSNVLTITIAPAMQESYTYIYALDRAIEGTLGAFGQPAVGWLTDPWLHRQEVADKLKGSRGDLTMG